MRRRPAVPDILGRMPDQPDHPEPRPPRASPAVYRRRRIVAGLLAFVVLVGVAWGISGLVTWIMGDEEQAAEQTAGGEEGAAPDDGAGAGSEDSTGTTGDTDAGDTGAGEAGTGDTGAGEAGPDDEPAVEGSCTASDLSVTASTGSEGYAADEAPLLVMSIENTGEESCSVDVGTGQQEFVVSRQGREIFTTAQCSDDRESLEVELEPGQPERAQISWPRADSSTDCSEPAELVSGTYELTVRLGGITSEPHEFTLD